MPALPVFETNFDREVLCKKGPVLVGFYFAGCVPCKKFMPTVEAFSAHHPELSVASVDSRKNPALAKRYQILTCPTLLLFRNGRPTARAVGIKTPSALEELIR